MSDTRDMYDYLKIDPDLLFKLTGTKGSFQRFITELHLTIQTGKTIQDIKSQLRRERAWAGVKIFYTEAKSIVSISISASAKDDDSKK
jgi:transcriptional regulator